MRSVPYMSFPVGQEAPDLKIGDFILTHRTGFIFKCISFGQGLRFRGGSKQYAYWNHAAFIASEKGDLIEALQTGVVRSHISKYKDTQYTVVRIADASDTDRYQALKFAEWCVGAKYGFLTIINLALWALFGGKFDFSIDGQEICSGLVARSLERFGEIFILNPTRNAPAHLAAHFDIVLPGWPHIPKGKMLK